MRCFTATILIATGTILAAVPSAGAATSRPVQTERIPVVPEELIELPDGQKLELPPEVPPATGAEKPAREDTPAVGDTPEAAPPQKLPEIFYGEDQLPRPVRELHQDLVAAAKSGDPEKLRPIIDSFAKPPIFSFGQVDDPIEYLVSISGDPEGREILAILLEVLEAGYVHVDQGTDQEMYLWPYFARYPFDAMTPPQMVEMFTLLTAGDFEDMKAFGAYIFFRLGIGPDGTWHFFVAGD